MQEEGALRGVRAIELGQLIAGPFCGQLLGDMGAEVIKVEAPGAGDPMRNWGHGDAKLWWEIIARNKKCVSADLRLPEGQAIVRELVKHSDILIENFKPGTMERWELGPELLHEINPKLIMVRVSGYGQTGPYANRAGFGAIGEAMGGWRAIVGDPDRPPSRMGISIGDTLAATYGCLGALGALHARERTGRGQVVDMALYEAVLQVMESLVPEYEIGGHVRKRTGPMLEGVAPSNVYSCLDGECLIAANQDSVFARLCSAMGRDELASDERFRTHRARGLHQRELDDLIACWTAEHGVAEIEALMVKHGVPAGRIFGAREMLDDEQFAAREALVRVDSPRWGIFHMQNAFPKLSVTPSGVRTLAPAAVGEDNDDVYRGLLGMSVDELAVLRDKAVI